MRQTGIIATLLLIFSLGTLGAPAVSAMSANAASENSYQNVLISYSQLPGNSEKKLIRAFGGDITNAYSNLPVIAAQLPERAISPLANNPLITAIEPNYEIFALNDYSAEDELANSWGVEHVGGAEILEEGHGGEGIKVAVIDSGVDYTHPDLAPNFDMGDLGYDTIHDNNNPMDVYGHGTHVAGSIGAVADDFGVVGVAPKIQLIALRVLDENGYSRQDSVLEALDWIIDYNENNPNDPITITNNSYGSGGSTAGLEVAFDALADTGVLHIAAAGNSGNRGGNNDTVIYPAKYDSVMAVSAIDENNQRPSWSSTGPDVEITAPGVSVLSTWNSGYSYATPRPFSFPEKENTYYKEGSGTSMAAPHVAGAAAVALGINSDFTNQEVRNLLRETAEDIGLRNHQQGSGLLRADRVMREALSREPAITGNITGAVTNASGVAIDGAQLSLLGADITTHTDASGAYSITDITTGEYELQVRADGYYEDSTPVAITDDSEQIYDFTLDEVPVHSLNGTVEDSEGNKIANVTISTSNGDYGTTTGEDGEYTIAMPEGNYTLLATKDGYSSKEEVVTLTTDKTLNFTLEEQSTEVLAAIEYEGRGGRDSNRHLETYVALTDTEEGALAGLIVEIELTTDGETWSYSGTTDSNGVVSFTLNNAPSGCYEADIVRIGSNELAWSEVAPEAPYCK